MCNMRYLPLIVFALLLTARAALAQNPPQNIPVANGGTGATALGQCFTNAGSVFGLSVPNRTVSNGAATVITTDMCGIVAVSGTATGFTLTGVAANYLQPGMSVQLQNNTSSTMPITSTLSLIGYGTSIPPGGGVNCVANSTPALVCTGLGTGQPTTLTAGTAITLQPPRGYAICTTTCTVTVPVPIAGSAYEFCAMNDDNISTVITLAALGSSAQYENQARTGYGTAGTGTVTSGGAIGDKICIIGRDATHYLTPTTVGTWTAH